MIQHTVNTPYTVGPVHFYTFELKDGSFIMFDTGPSTLEASSYINKRLNLQNLSYLFITHCHIDHYGLLHFIRENSNARIFISKYDYMKFKLFYERGNLLHKILEEEGFPKNAIDNIYKVFEYFKNILPDPDAEILEENIDLLQSLNISFIPCPGHSQSDIVYLYQNYAITGDVILKEIFQTPLFDIDFLNPTQRYNNYNALINTIEKLLQIKDKTFLPGHRDSIDDIKYRIEWYLEKLLNRTCRIGKRLMNDNLYNILLSMNIDTYTDPLTSYLKLSELFFMRDFISNKDPLVKTIEINNFNININQYLECIYEG